MPSFPLKTLDQFLQKATAATYAGVGGYEKKSQRPGYYELTFKDGDWFYRDSYTGHYRSWGTELVRFKGKPVWNALYGGGMADGLDHLSKDCFQFLKTCLTTKPKTWHSFRGPKSLTRGDWQYRYQQQGDIKMFSGYEEIRFKGKVVFSHRIIGGLIKDR